MRRLVRSITTALLLAAAATAGGLAASGAAHAGPESYRLDPGETLGAGQRLVSADGQYVLVMQTDGNLVMYAPGSLALWATGTNRPGSIVQMQTDGNLVVYAPGHVAVWASGTSGALHAEMQTDGNIVIYNNADHAARWASAAIRDRNNTGQVRYSGYVQMRDVGWAHSEWPSLNALWNGESGWRWNAANPSGAYGVPQAKPGDQMAAAGADWHENPATQIRWGLSYIQGRYGSPGNAYSVWLSRSPHWY
ncbi:hypothetical protein Cs7R123_02880 [Catellatospora sp. TT07R-123]|uniref:aggregation-promoting factor C-terminal-like domain-containing protein n=1 Tax=Catellatospora sp. TT07R-123 TaxID=2733863 RepID=UPI001B11B062|nr:hypothetical protein [Catellatospora sp. TT07R-123]GHJ42946.1 hypothetical protein Cs7R123_02880 [Catellatospora sp. TT07R-123]